MIKEQRQIMLDTLYEMYNIQPKYIKFKELVNDILTLKLIDEENTEAILIIDFANSKFKMSSDDFVEESHFNFITLE